MAEKDLTKKEGTEQDVEWKGKRTWERSHQESDNWLEEVTDPFWYEG